MRLVLWNNNVLKATDTLGREVSYEYDPMHNLTSVRRGEASRALTTESWQYDYRGNITNHIDRREKEEKFTYDLLGNLTEWIDKNNHKTIYTYDKVGNIIEVREPNSALTKYTYDDNGNLIQEDRHRAYEMEPVFYTNIRRYEYNKDNKLEAAYSGNILLVAYNYDGDGNITSTFDRDLDFNQNLNINNHSYVNSLTRDQRRLINKVPANDSFLYELTEYVIDRNQTYTQTLMERDGAGNLSTLYTYGNQRINSESINNLSGLYTYDGRGSVSAVIGGYGDFRASYWYDGLGNVKSQIHGYGAFGSGKKYYGYNAEQYNPVTGNQNLRARQVNIRRQRFLSEDIFLGVKSRTLSLNRYIYAEDNPLKYTDPSGNILPAIVIVGIGVSVVAGVVSGLVTGYTTGDWGKGLGAGVGTTLAVGAGIATGGLITMGASALGVSTAAGTATGLGVSIASNTLGSVITSVARDFIGNVALNENNDIGKNVIKSAIGGATFGGLNAKLGGLGASVKGIPNLVKNASITGVSAVGASIVEDATGKYAYGENISLSNFITNATLRGGVSYGLSGILNGAADKLNLSEVVKGNDSYDVASYLTSREYKSDLNFNQDELGITDIIRDYLVSQQNGRLDSLVTERYNLNNYFNRCSIK